MVHDPGQQSPVKSPSSPGERWSGSDAGCDAPHTNHLSSLGVDIAETGENLSPRLAAARLLRQGSPEPAPTTTPPKRASPHAEARQGSGESASALDTMDAIMAAIRRSPTHRPAFPSGSQGCPLPSSAEFLFTQGAAVNPLPFHLTNFYSLRLLFAQNGWTRQAKARQG